MNLSELKELLELIAIRDIAEFELEEEGVKLRIKKGTRPVNGGAPETTAVISRLPESPVSAAPEPKSEEAAEPAQDELSMIKAPMVGTFYRQPAPGSDPFVSVGDVVTKGQVLCIIEAMKLMNEIESELSGKIVEIYVDDGRPVQFGDKLFGIQEG